MEGAIVGSIVGYVVKKFGDFLFEEISLLPDTRRDLEWMQRELRFMQSYLDDAATKQTKDKRIRCWIEEVQKLAFQAEDMVDCLSSKGTDIIARYKFGGEVRMFKEDMEDMTKKITTYGIQPSEMKSSSSLQDDSLVEMRRNMATYRDQDNNDVVVGLKPHVDAVMERLQGKEEQRLVVSIVGMGGLGKTTLAKKVYRRMKERFAFQCTAWVVVSKEYNLLQLLQRIAQEVMNSSSSDLQHKNREELEKKLRQFLCEKRYLIVLDDVWETQVSNDFCRTFPDPGNGSRMIITTRSRKVGRSVNLGGFSPYELPVLGEEAAWELFARKVFPYKKNPEECFTNDELKRLGKEMVAKCKGLPLAIIVLGGLLSSLDKTHYEWSKIADGTQWNEPEMEEGCMRILALSYQALPVDMRCCFVYLGIFPEDTVIDVPDLLRLWIAEGFIIKTDGKDLEKTAERYVEELIQRCLVQVVERNSYGAVVSIRVHDLLLELAITEAKRGRFLEIWRNGEDVNSASNARRLVVATDVPKHVLFNRNLRSLFVRSGMITHSSCFKNLNLLRVLSASSDCLPIEVGLFVNLQYLGVSVSPDSVSSLGKLKYLQTLRINIHAILGPGSLWLWQIKTLRHVICNDFKASGKAPIGDNILPNLRTLRNVRPGPWIKNILPMLNNLRELCVWGIGEEWMVESINSAIQNLQQLNYLKLEGLCITEMEQILLSANTHRHLYELVILGPCIFHGSNKWSCRGLPQNLSKVNLESVYIHSNILKELGSLQSLKELTLYWTRFEEEQEHMVFEGRSFPQLRVLQLKFLYIKWWVLELPCLGNLTRLEIDCCDNLEALPEGLQHIRTLECLHLKSMRSWFVERNRGLMDELHCKIDINDN